jgi:hypothetical protein
MGEAEPIQETRTLAVKDVVITPADLVSLLEIIRESIRSAPGYGKTGGSSEAVRMTINALDGSSYSGTDSGIAGSGILDNQSVKSVSIDAMSAGSRIDVDLYHDSSHRDSTVRVIGTDPIWVNGTMRRLEQVVAGLEPQWKWSRRGTWAFVSASEVGIAAAAIAVALFIASLEPERRPLDASPWSDSLYPTIAGVLGVAGVGFGWVLGLSAKEYIGKLWPSVELRTGREYMNVEARKRRRVIIVVSLVVLPFVVSFVASIAAALVMD